VINLEQRGALVSVLIGSARRITLASVFKLLILRMIATHPVGEAAPIVRHPAGEFTRREARVRARSAPADAT
jgi:hypothetical protein